MGLFEHWPYTNFHDLNLDWIIKQVKELGASYKTLDEAYTALTEKVNELIDKDLAPLVLEQLAAMKESGELADILAGVVYDSEFDINSTIPLQNKTVTADVYTERANNKTLSCAYAGSYIAPPASLPSSFVFVNDRLYTFDAVEQTTNNGNVRVFDLTNNINVPGEEKSIRLQHANSACLNKNDNFIYIVPTWDFSAGGRANAVYLLKYDATLTSYTIVNTDSQPLGVTYDEALNAMYYLDYNWTVYKYDEESESFSLYSTIAHDNVDNYAAFNQDFCMHNGVFHISSPAGNLCTGYLQADNSQVTTFETIRHTDIFENYYIGELEGMEYINGVLYAIAYTHMNANWKTAFMLQIGAGFDPAITLDNNYGRTNRTVNINANTAAKFKLLPYELHSLAQNSVLQQAPATFAIGASGTTFTDPVTGAITLRESCLINLRGAYTVYSLDLGSGIYDIRPDSGSYILTFNTTGSCITHQRAAILKIGAAASSPMQISTPNITGTAVPLINIGTSGDVTFIRGALTSSQGKELRVGSTAAGTHSGFEMFIGGAIVINYPA